MKNIIKAALVAAGIFCCMGGYAQTRKDSTIGHKISKTAKKVGHKTSQIAASGAAAVVDKKYEGKCGPQGQTVYINEHSRYYYIDKKGHRVYLKKSELRDKQKS
ncbi:MAG TPA: hypothetical protein VHA56_20230 [Mucilaginibacter sp.]|nr:hypothetical protein [Mucilaginibacter sp.]